MNLYLVPFRVEIIFDDVCPLFLTWSRINHITVKETKKFKFQSTEQGKLEFLSERTQLYLNRF